MNKHLWRGWLIAQGRVQADGIEAPPPMLDRHHHRTLPVARGMAGSSRNSVRALRDGNLHSVTWHYEIELPVTRCKNPEFSFLEARP